MRFWLGTHMANWLEQTDVDLFVSHRRLRKYKRRLPRARGRWALDSGGFTELSMFGEWRTSEDEYVEAVARYAEEVGGLEWAAPMDWMCEPFVTEKTGLSVLEHQLRTIDNFLALRERGPFIPVLQGWTRGEYERHVELYDDASVDLRALPLVGIGSVCRRQQTRDTEHLVATLSMAGIRLHGFGMKVGGLSNLAWALASSDSMSWSFRARKHGERMPGCSHRAAMCNNCLAWALAWRERIVGDVIAEQQPRLLA